MAPTQTPSPADTLAKRRRYRRLMFGFLLGGVGLGLLLREVLQFPLASEAVYWLGVLGFLAVWLGTSVTLFDERDAALERRASQLTLLGTGVVLAVGASAARILSTVGYEIPAVVGHALYAFVAQFVLFGVVYGVLRVRR
ncbi:MAG: DUF2178 domain-containing protein [Halobaculum sp.]